MRVDPGSWSAQARTSEACLPHGMHRLLHGSRGIHGRSRAAEGVGRLDATPLATSYFVDPAACSQFDGLTSPPASNDGGGRD